VILSISLWRFSIQHLLQIGELLPSSPTFSPSSLQLLAGKLVMLTKVQTFVSTMWQIGPQLEFILVAFSSFPHYPHIFLHVLEKIPPPPSLFHKLDFSFFSFFLQCTHRKKKKKKKKKKNFKKKKKKFKPHGPAVSYRFHVLPTRDFSIWNYVETMRESTSGMRH